MLKCDLINLLAEHNLRVTKVSADTGISRSTLTSLINNASQGIQFDTLDTLCTYLNITPAQFFRYTPIDIEFVTDGAALTRELRRGVVSRAVNAYVDVRFTKRGALIRRCLFAEIIPELSYDGYVNKFAINLVFSGDAALQAEAREQFLFEKQAIVNAVNALPQAFLYEAEQSVINAVNAAYAARNNELAASKFTLDADARANEIKRLDTLNIDASIKWPDECARGGKPSTRAANPGGAEWSEAHERDVEMFRRARKEAKKNK